MRELLVYDTSFRWPHFFSSFLLLFRLIQGIIFARAEAEGPTSRCAFSKLSKSAGAWSGSCMQIEESETIGGSSSFIYIYYGDKPLRCYQKKIRCRPLINYLTVGFSCTVQINQMKTQFFNKRKIIILHHYCCCFSLITQIKSSNQE